MGFFKTASKQARARGGKTTAARKRLSQGQIDMDPDVALRVASFALQDWLEQKAGRFELLEVSNAMNAACKCALDMRTLSPEERVRVPMSDERFECPLCFEPMNALRRPCAFSLCEHSLCTFCVQKLPLERSCEAVLVACPLCRKLSPHMNICGTLPLRDGRFALLRGSPRDASCLRGTGREATLRLESGEAARLDGQALQALRECVVSYGDQWGQWWRKVARAAALAHNGGEPCVLRSPASLQRAMREQSDRKEGEG